MLGTAPLPDAQRVAHAPRIHRRAPAGASRVPRLPRAPAHGARAQAQPRPFVIARTMPARAAVAASAARPARLPATRSFLVPLLGLFALLNAGDLASTYVGLLHGMREGNPLMGALLAQYGFGALILYKLLVIAAVVAGIMFLRAFHRRVASVTIWVCNALVLLVVVINVAQYLAIR